MAGATDDPGADGDAQPGAGDLVGRLLGLRDELAAAAGLVVALVMACRALDIGRSERSALAELANTARDRLEVVLTTFDSLIASEAKR